MDRLETVAESDEFRIWDKNRLKKPNVFLSTLVLDEKRDELRQKAIRQRNSEHESRRRSFKQTPEISSEIYTSQTSSIKSSSHRSSRKS